MFAREQIQAFARKREQAAAQVAAVQQQLVAVTKQRDAKASGTASARPKPSTNFPAGGSRQTPESVACAGTHAGPDHACRLGVAITREMPAASFNVTTSDVAIGRASRSRSSTVPFFRSRSCRRTILQLSLQGRQIVDAILLGEARHDHTAFPLA